MILTYKNFQAKINHFNKIRAYITNCCQQNVKFLKRNVLQEIVVRRINSNFIFRINIKKYIKYISSYLFKKIIVGQYNQYYYK